MSKGLFLVCQPQASRLLTLVIPGICAVRRSRAVESCCQQRVPTQWPREPNRPEVPF